MTALRVTRVKVHRAGVRQMLGAQFTVDEMRRRINLARILAIMIAPIDSGNYVSRFARPDAVVSGRNQRGVAFARLSNDAKNPQEPGGYCYADALERGNSRMRAQRILRRALRAVAD